jgi:hypothetical protein
LTFPYVLSGAALLLAAATLLKWRQTARRLERLAESYWELRYDYGQLRARLDRLEGTGSGDAAAPGTSTPASTSFIPLSSLKK